MGDVRCHHHEAWKLELYESYNMATVAAINRPLFEMTHCQQHWPWSCSIISWGRGGSDAHAAPRPDSLQCALFEYAILFKSVSQRCHTRNQRSVNNQLQQINHHDPKKSIFTTLLYRKVQSLIFIGAWSTQCESAFYFSIVSSFFSKPNFSDISKQTLSKFCQSPEELSSCGRTQKFP